MRLSAVVVLAACMGTTHVPAARFAAHADWTPAAYRLDARPPHHASPHDAIDLDAMVDDVAFLEHALAEAWPDGTPASGILVRERGREVPDVASKTLDKFCYELAEAYRLGGIALRLDGARCGSVRVQPAPPIRRAAIPAQMNYVWHKAPGDPVGVLAIGTFAPPGDPGWANLAETLAEVATTDFIVLDLQSATGDDPRAGFAVLAALGLDSFKRNPPRPMTARDTAMADVTRANFAALHRDVAARSRALWQGFDSEAAVVAIGRTLTEVRRSAPPVKIEIVAGSACGVACQMTLSLAEFQDRVEVVSTTGVEDALDGDERGAIRLPRSGIEVTFPTVSYGTPFGGSVFGSHVAGVDLVAGELEQLHRLAGQRAERKQWDAAALPDCRELAADDVDLNKKRGGCYEDGKTAEVILSATIGGERLRTFATRCGLAVGSVLEGPINGETIATASGPREAIARLAHAGFVRSIEWSCPMQLE